MKRSLAVVLALLPACVHPWDDPPPDSTPDPPRQTGRRPPSIDFFEDRFRCDGLCAIAEGGMFPVQLDPRTWVDAELVTSNVEVTTLAPTYHKNYELRPSGSDVVTIDLVASDNGALVIFDHHELDVRPIHDVQILPSAVLYPDATGVTFMTKRHAYSTLDPIAYITLTDAGGEYLVDASLAFAAGSDGRVTQLWGMAATLDLGTTAGTLDVVIEAESFAPRPFSLVLVDHVDRVETVITELPARQADHGTVCFHAFTGDHEVALPEHAFSFTIENALDEGGDASFANCRRFQAHAAGATIRVTGTAQGVSATVELPIAE